jgi:hypothetical protein
LTTVVPLQCHNTLVAARAFDHQVYHEGVDAPIDPLLEVPLHNKIDTLRQKLQPYYLPQAL